MLGEAAVVVLSGGQDSTTCLGWAKQNFNRVHAVTFNYGQRHRIEIEAATVVARILRADSHEIRSVQTFNGSSPLTDHARPLETYKSYESMDLTIGSRVELTYVPHRNATFILEAAKYAESLSCRSLITGVCEADNANYPDCRRTFIDAMVRMLNLSLGVDRMDRGAAVEIITPLISRTKAESIWLAQKIPGVMNALGFSHTCYAGRFPPCGECHACVLRAEGFRLAGVEDPLIVRATRYIHGEKTQE